MSVVLPTMIVEVDWDADDSFTDETANVAELATIKGRQGVLDLDGIGECTVVLRNDDNRYTPLNSGSAIYPDVTVGKALRVRTTSPTTISLFTGTIETIEELPDLNRRSVMLRCLDRMAQDLQDSGPIWTVVTDTSVTADGVAHILGPAADGTGPRTGHAVKAVLDETAIAAGDQDLDLGVSELDAFAAGGETALEALDRIVEAEGGRRYVDGYGDFRFEARDYRFQGAQKTSAQTYSDQPGATYKYDDIKPAAHDLSTVHNTARCAALANQQVDTARLWELAVPEDSSGNPIGLKLEPGEALTVYPTWPEYCRDASSISVTRLVNRLPDGTGQNLWSNTTTAISEKKAQRCKVVLTNLSTSVTCFVIGLTLDADALQQPEGEPLEVEASDATSVAAYGTRLYPGEPEGFGKVSQAAGWAGFIKGRFKNPTPHITLDFVAYNSTVLTELLTRDLSDRVAVKNAEMGYGANGIDHFVEGIEHRLQGDGEDPDRTWKTTMHLSRVVNANTYWILGDSTYGKLGSTTRLFG